MPPLGITMGCPSGIGPEIIVRYFTEQQKRRIKEPKCVVLGDLEILSLAQKLTDCPISIIPWKPGTDIPDKGIAVLQLSQLKCADHRWGSPTRETGQAMGNYIKTGVSLTLDGHLSGIVTCPISKYALKNAGYDFPGHTEMLAELTNSREYGMMMAGTRLRVTLVTIHCSLAEVPARLSEQSIYRMILTTHKALKYDLGIPAPRIGVAGLNPHGGENLLFGSEELQHITPAVRRAQQDQIAASGPYPPDTIFHHAASGAFDAVVCMYHDQGLIPFKLLHFSDGVNVTLGLPIVRTSVDHGTAYDIAGQNKADPSSLAAAVQLAQTISENRANHGTRQT